MPEPLDAEALVTALLAETAEAAWSRAWDSWRAEWGAALEGNGWMIAAAEWAHKSGFQDGMALLASQVEAVLAAAEADGAPPAAPERSTGTGWPVITVPGGLGAVDAISGEEEGPATDS